MGRIEVRDALDATDDLTRARNSLTAALINYRIGLLELYLDMGLLRVDEDGLSFASLDEYLNGIES